MNIEPTYGVPLYEVVGRTIVRQNKPPIMWVAEDGTEHLMHPDEISEELGVSVTNFSNAGSLVSERIANPLSTGNRLCLTPKQVHPVVTEIADIAKISDKPAQRERATAMAANWQTIAGSTRKTCADCLRTPCWLRNPRNSAKVS